MSVRLKIANGRKKNASPFARIDDAIDSFRAGKIIIVCDDEDRENEGDLTLAAEKVTPEVINFMMHRACGMVCLAMSPAICDRMHLEPMAGASTSISTTTGPSEAVMPLTLVTVIVASGNHAFADSTSALRVAASSSL